MQNNKVFTQYAKYYNLLYADKDYQGEAMYVDTLIKRFSPQSAKSLLDIGCGTGNHASFMSALGYKITGVDMSEEMIENAKTKQIPNSQFIVGRASEFRLQERFDVITSLFHVLSYQTDNFQLLGMISNIAEHLNPEGLFVFDFWYAPAVMTERPSVRIKRLEDNDIKVTRIAEPVLIVNENKVEVNFELLIEDKHNKQLTVVRELHPMRYFSVPEIEMLLESYGMQLVYAKEWMTEVEPSEKTWGVCCVGKKC